MANDLDVQVTNAHNDTLPPLPPPEEMAGEGFDPGSGGDGAEEPLRAFATPEQVKTLLWLTYKAGEWKTGYEDIWAVDEEFLLEIARRITPDINRLPEIIAKMIIAGDQKSGWALLVIDYGRRVAISTVRTRERMAAATAAQQEEENGYALG